MNPRRGRAVSADRSPTRPPAPAHPAPLAPRETPAFWAHRATLEHEHEANGWATRDSHARRLLTVTRYLHRLSCHGETVLDYGCGTGALAELWAAPGYVGYDRSPQMIARAQRRSTVAPHPYAPRFIARDDGGRYDLIVAIGTFNLRPYTERDLRAAIGQLWARARRALLVSVLRPRDDHHQDPDHLRMRPDTLARIGQHLSGRYTLDCSYHPNDALLVVERHEPQH